MKRILLQGFTSENHVSAVKHVLELACPERVVLCAAFINGGGIRLLRESLKPVAQQSTILAGIRNGITSAQGLAGGFELGCSVYAVDAGPQPRIFHPKIYMSRNLNEARLVVGSTNLTRAGLRDNIEASLLMELNIDEPDNRYLINALEHQIDDLIAEYPNNVLRISSHSDIQILLDSERVIDESLEVNQTVSASRYRHDQDRVPRMILKSSDDVLPNFENENNEDAALPKQVDFIIPLQVALRQLGGSGTNDAILERVVHLMRLPEDLLGVRDKRKPGRSKIKNLLAFAKVRLKLWQYIDGTPTGGGRYWLTEKGRTVDIHDPQALLRKPDSNQR